MASEDKRLYVRFINMMVNDSQHLLMDALARLPEVRRRGGGQGRGG